jgi:hypothetical protein
VASAVFRAGSEWRWGCRSVVDGPKRGNDRGSIEARRAGRATEGPKQRGFWVEIVTLLISGYNDSEAEIRELARFLASDTAFKRGRTPHPLVRYRHVPVVDASAKSPYPVRSTPQDAQARHNGRCGRRLRRA